MRISVLVKVLLATVLLAACSAAARVEVEPTLLLRRANHLQAEKEYSQAVGLYIDLTSLRPQWAEPHTGLGEIFVAQGRWDAAQSEFTLAKDLNAHSGRPLHGLAQVAYHRGHPQTAIALWQRAVALDHGDAEARYRLGQVYLEVSDLVASRRELQGAVMHEEDHQGANYLLGLLVAAQDRDLAVQHFTRAAAGRDSTVASRAQDMLNTLAEISDPRDDAYASARLAHAYMIHQMPSLALTQLNLVLDLKPDNHTARAYAGYALFALGDNDRARQTLREVTQVDPKNPLAHFFLGLLHRSEGYLPTSLWDFKRSLRLDPANAAVYAEIASTYQRMGQYVTSEEWYLSAVAVAPDEPGFRLLLAQFYVDVIPRPQKAVTAAREAAALLPDDALSHELLGWALSLSGDPVAGRSALEKALRLDPDFARAYYHLGVVCTQLGDLETARWAYQRAIDLDSEGVYRQKAAEEL